MRSPSRTPGEGPEDDPADVEPSNVEFTAVDSPAVDSPAVDSPAVDSRAADSRAADSRAADTDELHRERMRALQAEQRSKVRERTVRRGVIVVHTGHGKGKSTAAFGIAIRAAGHGQRVGLVQFIKGNWKTGEQAAIRRFPEITHVVSGEGFTWNTQDRSQDMRAAQRGWEAAKSMIEAAHRTPPGYDVVILDELNIALRYAYLPLEDVVATVSAKPEALSIVVTGRDAPQALIDVADTVTEMRQIKHAFAQGIRARRGVEF